ncbi:MAG: hypothetical protein K0Q76_2296 [Panacagrimonas sp.]|nr:radical SAM protein [Panacagrimonas sp.]MCC2657188.1 hypothetical protein [Panacagrimonas sp.]
MIVLWRITERCDLACGFCAYDRRLRRTRHDADVGSIRRFAAVLGALQRRTGERVLLSWLGGEPLRWTPLFALCEELRRDHALSLSLTTNGSTLDRATVRAAILANLSELTVSVDGFAEFHDRTRGRAGLWQRIRDGVVALARDRDPSGLRLRANVVLMRDNLEDFPALCAELADWGIDEITFNALGGRDRPEFHPAHRLRTDDTRRLAEGVAPLRDRLALRGVRLCGGQSYLSRIHAAAEGRALSVGDCAPAERFLFVDEQGRLAPCSFTCGDYGVHVDEVQTLEDLFALPGRFRAARTRAPAPTCGDCPSNHVFAKFASR